MTLRRVLQLGGVFYKRVTCILENDFSVPQMAGNTKGKSLQAFEVRLPSGNTSDLVKEPDLGGFQPRESWCPSFDNLAESRAADLTQLGWETIFSQVRFREISLESLKFWGWCCDLCDLWCMFVCSENIDLSQTPKIYSIYHSFKKKRITCTPQKSNFL